MEYERTVVARCDGMRLEGDLNVPVDPVGVVLFVSVEPPADGVPSADDGGRRSPADRRLASAFGRARLASLLFDFVTPGEAIEVLGSERFATEALVQRVLCASERAGREADVGGLPIGLMGAGVGSVASLVAAARLANRVAAVVCRGGRVDLAARALPEVRAPTLFVVGGDDAATLRLHRRALLDLRGAARLEVVPASAAVGASEAGGLRPVALDSIARLAAAWFRLHFAGWTGALEHRVR